jgi:hypothetical protein
MGSAETTTETTSSSSAFCEDRGTINPHTSASHTIREIEKGSKKTSISFIRVLGNQQNANS